MGMCGENVENGSGDGEADQQPTGGPRSVDVVLLRSTSFSRLANGL